MKKYAKEMKQLDITDFDLEMIDDFEDLLIVTVFKLQRQINELRDELNHYQRINELDN